MENLITKSQFQSKYKMSSELIDNLISVKLLKSKRVSQCLYIEEPENILALRLSICTIESYSEQYNIEIKDVKKLVNKGLLQSFTDSSNSVFIVNKKIRTNRRKKHLNLNISKLAFKELYTSEEYCELKGIKLWTLRAWTRDNKVEHIKIGKNVYFLPDDLFNLSEKSLKIIEKAKKETLDKKAKFKKNVEAPKGYITLNDYCKKFDLDRNTVNYHVYQNKIDFKRVDRNIFVSEKQTPDSVIDNRYVS